MSNKQLFMNLTTDPKLKHKVIKTVKNNYKNFNEDKFFDIIKNTDDVLYHLIENIPIYFKKDKTFSEKRYELVFNNIKNIKPNLSSIVDIGAYNGEITQKFQKQFNIPKRKTFLVDKIKPKEIICKHKKFFSSTNKIKSNSIDIVICLMTLHHIKNHEEVIKESQRILKKGGLFFIRESNNKKQEDIYYHKIMDIIYFNWHNKCEINNSFYYNSKEYWIQLIEENGFYTRKIEESEPKNYFRPFHGYFIKK